MAKICMKCGVKHKNDAVQCLACGEPFPDAHVVPERKKWKLIAIIGVILVAVAALVIGYLTSPHAVVIRVMNCYERGDADGVIATYPGFLMESDMIDKQTLINDTAFDVKLGKDTTVSYNLEKAQSPSSSEREQLMEDFRYFGGMDFKDSDIEDIKIIWVNYKADYAGLWPNFGTRFIIIKYQGRWCWWPANVNR